jgi:type II secretory ATPase GspE/PulE/Tfp pilus assembly ATPase PilB-like protein
MSDILNKLDYAHNIDDLELGYEVVLEANEKSPFLLDNGAKRNMVLLKYTKGTGNATRDRILLLVNDKIISQYQSKLVQIRTFAKRRGFVFQVKKCEGTKLVEGIYKAFAKKNSGLAEEKNDIINLVDDIFIKGLNLGTSDLHIEKRADKTTLKMRVNGELSKIDTFFPEEGDQIAKIIYQVYTSEGGGESATTFDPKKCLNGLIDKTFDGQRVRARIATAPANPVGFDMVCRLLPFSEDGKALPLSALGYSAREINEVEIMKSKSIGGVIVAGVTGSGKSTTLKNILLSKLSENEGGIKCITVEDPPEYFIPGATQVPVNREVSGVEAFQDAIRAAMRMDPDIIMVGEVRDLDTGKLLRGAIESGHQVFTTVHASSAFGILNRLENLGISRETLAAPDFISGLIYQRLLPKLCEHCSVGLINGKVPRRHPFDKILLDDIEFYGIDFEVITDVKSALKPKENLVRKLQDMGLLTSKKANKAFQTYREINDEEKNVALLDRIKVAADINDCNIRFRGQGCKHCNSGIAGRLVCAETVIPDLELLRLLGEGADADATNYWKINMKGKFAMEDAIDKMKAGTCDPLDVEHAFQNLDVKKV